MSLGSAMATVSVRPSRLSGSTTPFVAMSAGTSLRILGSTSNRDRSTAGIRYWRARTLVISSSGTSPSFTRT